MIPLLEKEFVKVLVKYFLNHGFTVERRRVHPSDKFNNKPDFVLNREIAVEVKCGFDISSLQRGIGQCMLSLCKYKQAWLIFGDSTNKMVPISSLPQQLHIYVFKNGSLIGV